MAATPYKLEILTPDGLVYSGEVEFVSTRTESGSIGIYARHQPLLALLAPGELRITEPGGEIKHLAQGEGYVQIAPERVLLLVEEAFESSELDIKALKKRVAAAKERLEAAEPGSEDAKHAERDERRAAAFLAVAEAGAPA